MLCQKCGSQNPDGSTFCQYCGSPLSAAQAQPQPQPQPPMSAYAPPPPPKPKRPQPSNPVHALLFQQVSGPLFLTAASAYSAMLLFKLIASFSVGNWISTFIQQLQGLIGYGSGGFEEAQMIQMVIDLYSRYLSGIAVFLALISMTPAIVIAVAIWLVFYFVRKNDGAPISTVPFTMIRVVAILKLIGVAISLVAGESILCLYLVGTSNVTSESAPIILGIVLMLITAGIAILNILYYLKLMNILNTMQDTVLTLHPSDDIPNYVAIFGFVLAFFTLFSIPFSGGGLGALSRIASIVALIAFGVFLLGYKKDMRLLMTGAMPTMPSQPEPQPAPAYGFQPTPQPAPAYGFQPTPQTTPQPAPQSTTVLNDNSAYTGNTTILSSSPLRAARLVRLKNNTVTMLDRPVTHIGKDPATCECAITDNGAVSHAHAEIWAENGTYYIVDKSSTNHVYLRGTQIPPESKFPLENGMDILIANEPFRFELM